MNGKPKMLAAGLAALLIFGLVTAVNAASEGISEGPGFRKGSGMNGMRMAHDADLSELGLPEDATREEIHEALWQKRLTDLGLNEDSTVSEFHEAMKAKHEEKRLEMLGKLGLSDDASHEEIHEARKAYCEENPDDCPRRGGRGGRRGMHGEAPIAE